MAYCASTFTTMDLTAIESTTSSKLYYFHWTFWSYWIWRSLRPLVFSSILGLHVSGLAIQMQSILLSPAARRILVLIKTNRKKPCSPLHLVCCKMSRKGRKLLDKVSHGVKGGFPYDCVKREGFHIPSHHLCDGGHGHRDLCHVCAVNALEVLN